MTASTAHDRRSPRADVGAVPDVPGPDGHPRVPRLPRASRGRSSSSTSRSPRSPRSARPRPSCSATSSTRGSRTPSGSAPRWSGALVLALTRSPERHVSQEAVIGVVYAVSSAAAVLLADRSPHGAEHLRGMLVGQHPERDRPARCLKVAVLYGAVGVFHWLCRRPFFLISTDPAGAYRAGWRVRLWDFLFYASFGVVVTSSVRIARRPARLLLPDRARPGRHHPGRHARPATRHRLGLRHRRQRARDGGLGGARSAHGRDGGLRLRR